MVPALDEKAFRDSTESPDLDVGLAVMDELTRSGTRPCHTSFPTLHTPQTHLSPTPLVATPQTCGWACVCVCVCIWVVVWPGLGIDWCVPTDAQLAMLWNCGAAEHL